MRKVDKPLRVENLGELQIWIEGQFALVKQAQATSGEDLKTVRAKVHDLSNDMAAILALDIPGKLSRLEEADKVHEASIKRFSDESIARRASVATLKTLWGLGGVAIGAILTMALEVYKVIHP